ncbi:MAG TPA: fimbria/pilus outer membrane usher protein [Usitatibacter sp.]|nr:fimbria/pilus outer membrane usher protein [Usitatibacter sp.]
MAAHLALSLWVATAAAQSPSPASPPADRPLPLDVVVNGAKTGTWIFVERGGSLYAPREAFEEWRVQLRPDAPAIQFQGQEYRALSAVPGFKSKIDFANQSVELTFSPQAFAMLRMTRELEKRPVVSPVLPSVFANYDISYSTSSPRGANTARDLGVLSEVGVSNDWGVLTTSSAARNLTDDPDVGQRRTWLRLETTFTRDFPDENRTLRIGDTATRRAMWGRDVYFGGVRFGTNFALTPGFVSQPLPAVTGLSAAPSTVELYVNDVLRQTSSVPPGPFVIDNFPTVTGNGEARLVVRDLLGRETVIVQSFFSSAQMLARGLTDWSAEAGTVREDLGVRSNEYGEAFAAGTWRHGFSNTLTVEGRAEATRKLKLIGAGMLTVLPWNVVAKAALVGTQHTTLGSGGHWLMGLEYQGLRGGASIEVARSSDGFRELGQLENASRIREQVAGNLTYATETFGTFGLAYADIRRFDATRIQTISGNYSMRVGEKGTLTMTASKVLSGGTGSAVGMTLLLPLDDGIVTNATVNKRGDKKDHYLAAVHNPGVDGDLGWRVLAGEQQNQRRAEGGLYYQGNHGALTADASLSPAQRAVRVGAMGGLVFADGHLFTTRRADESFALVEIAGYRDVGVGLGGGGVLARTDEAGIALVPRLLPYLNNSVRINARELPINAELATIEQNAVPAWRSGVKVVFPVRSGRGALLRIVFQDNEPAPPGAVIQVEGDKEEFYVARRGEAFVTGLKPVDKVTLRWNGQRCDLEVKLPAESADEIPRVGPLLCKGVPR